MSAEGFRRSSIRWFVLFGLLFGAFPPVLSGCSDSGTEPDKIDYVPVASDVAPVLGTYFFLSDPDSSDAPAIVPGSLRVWLDDRYYQNDVELGARESEVWLDPVLQEPTNPCDGRFHMLQEGIDYDIVENTLYGRPLLVLDAALRSDEVLAISYREVVALGDTVEVGWVPENPSSMAQLKMIRPNEETWGANLLPQSVWAPARRLELRNVYDLQMNNIDPETFHLRIVRDLGVTTEVFVNEFGVRTPLIQVLGLDQHNNDDPSDLQPDGRIDPERIDYTDGLLFFPDLRPFDPSLTDIQGNGYRERSWPAEAGGARPDTLGWYLAGGQPVRSSLEVQADETVPEIYDYRPDYLFREAAFVHWYLIEVGIAD